MADLPRSFWLIRRAGADDDAWEFADADQVAGVASNSNFEVQECRPAGLPDPRLFKLLDAVRRLPGAITYDQLKGLAEEIGRELRDGLVDAEGAARSQAIAAIDDLFAYLTESGLVEEGGGLPLVEAMKPAADARAALAALQAPIQEEGEAK